MAVNTLDKFIYTTNYNTKKACVNVYFRPEPCEVWITCVVEPDRLTWYVPEGVT